MDAQRDCHSVLTYPDIRDLVKTANMIEDFDESHFQGASYDLRVGDECFYRGETIALSESESKSLTIGPHEVAIVSSVETFYIPTNVVARYDLRMNFLWRGLVLQVGLHLDPGYEGKVWSLLFNLSDKPVELKYMKRFASMEFTYTSKPVPENMIHWTHGNPVKTFEMARIPLNRIERSGLGLLKDNIETIRERVNEGLRRWDSIYIVSSIVVAVAMIAIMAVTIPGAITSVGKVGMPWWNVATLCVTALVGIALVAGMVIFALIKIASPRGK